jgi:hypothetical protein
MFCRDKDYNFNISQEDAFEMQERMLRESAARVARMHSSDKSKQVPKWQLWLHISIANVIQITGVERAVRVSRLPGTHP